MIRSLPGTGKYTTKRLYDPKAKLRSFQSEDIVYLYNTVRKPGKRFNFHKFWTGPLKITVKLSDLNYEIIGTDHKKQTLHVNRVKMAYDSVRTALVREYIVVNRIYSTQINCAGSVK